jgi:hypothetical protein
MGVVRTSPSGLAITPLNQGGQRLHDIYKSQTIDHIHMLLHDGRTKTITGQQLIRTTQENSSLQPGSTGDPLQIPILDRKDIALYEYPQYCNPVKHEGHITMDYRR